MQKWTISQCDHGSGILKKKCDCASHYVKPNISIGYHLKFVHVFASDIILDIIN